MRPALRPLPPQGRASYLLFVANENRKLISMISVIIPTLNEAQSVPRLIRYLQSCPDAAQIEIIVVDGSSSDGTLEALQRISGIILETADRGRASQMNAGSDLASGQILYFLHADTYPPRTFVRDILLAVESGVLSGSYRLRFDCAHWFLRFNAWFTRFPFTPFRFGDQSLFVTSDVFKHTGRFATLQLMEDQEFVSRLTKTSSFAVLNKQVETSARKYLRNGIFRLQFVFFILYCLYQLGLSQQKLVAIYQQLIDKRCRFTADHSFKLQS
jgi:rSAM/selenodomain-associated transferase 2